MTNIDGSLLASDSFYVTEDTKILMSLETLRNSCLSQLNADYQKGRNITSSHQEAIAWVGGKVGDTVTWSANDYAPDLEFDMTAENMNVPMTINDDKRGGSFGPLYSKDSVYNDSVWVDTTHFVLSYEEYEKTSTVTIERGEYTSLQIANMIATGFNAIDGYQVFTREEYRGLVILNPRSGVYPSMIVISNDNPYLPLTPGITRGIKFTFHRNYYIRMPELTTPYEFALANIDGLTAMNMISGHTYSNREIVISFIQPTRVAFVGSPSFTSVDFVDWEQPQSYTATTTIRFPYGMMTLDNKNAETDITYTDDAQTFTWSIPSRLTQADLVWRLNQCFDSAALNIQWIPESDGYYIHADYVFSLSGNLGTIIPTSGSQSHTWRIPFDDGVYYVNYGPMVGEYPVDITNGLSNIRLYCNIVKSKTTPLLTNVPMDSLYKNYFYKNRMLIPCSELLDRIEYELKDENDEPLSFIGNIYLLIGFTVLNK